ncbi:MAG: hypothetical protein PHU21_12500 [Elusimicrobia bacterium]|jgi:hypothetical protein|nr:hypothetical protein [Elusimicrobiota bacterium]
MEAPKIGMVMLAAAAAACAGAPAPKTAETTAYYYGEVSAFSPDGRLPYNKTESAVKRQVLEGGALVRETTTVPGIAPSMPPTETILELRRRGRSLAYGVSGSGGASGTVRFASPELKAWTCEVRLKDGGSLTGSGEIRPDGMRSRKTLSGVARPMAVGEDLKPVTESEYRMRLYEMLPRRGAE